jgi:glutamyl-Q tRNA(Asp) synthetase
MAVIATDIALGQLHRRIFLMTAPVTRFAPSPTGYLHLGHAYAALFAARAAAEGADGRFLLRIEDIDAGRCRPGFEDAIFEDLAWLGLAWERPVLRQSERGAAYDAALDRLAALGVLYPCFCTRKEIAAEIARAGAAPQETAGPDGPLYPGTCRNLSAGEREARMAASGGAALRIDAARAGDLAGALSFSDKDAGDVAVDPLLLGDAVLARKDIGTSYHLAVVVDDADQDVTLVTRGADLLPSAHLHRVLQALLGLPEPRYHHHPLINDASGARLAKRDNARAIRTFREEGMSPAEVWALAGFPG